MGYDWNFLVIIVNSQAFILGAITTLKISIFVIIIGTILGMFLSLSLAVGGKFLKRATIATIEIVRSIPVLVLLVWIYYCLPIFVGITFSAFTTAVIALSINMSVFSAEIFRSGLESIPKGFSEAGRCLGLSKFETFWYITMPQAGREMLPAMVNLNITMLKFTSLASVISVNELLHAGNDVITQTFRPLEVYTSIAIFYIILIVPFSLYSRKFETTVYFSKKS